MYEIKVKIDNETKTLKTIENKVLLDLLRENVIDIPAPCGGKGKCGKCIIQLVDGKLSEPDDQEINLLGKDRIAAGYRLSCMCKVIDDCSISIPKTDDAEILTDVDVKFQGNALVKRLTMSLEKPSVEDQTSDLERIRSKYGETLFTNNNRVINLLPGLLRDNDYNPNMITIEDKIADIVDKDSESSYFGVAVDIGTTTVAVYLYDFKNNHPEDNVSFLNPQRPFGADVISRIESVIQSEDNQRRQSELIIESVNNAIDKMCKNNSIKHTDIYTVSFVGNTTMTHLLMNITPENIASSPFIPATTMLHRIKPMDLNIKINQNGILYVLPCIAGYVGADTVGAIYACSMHDKENITLLCDIGTNGEIVLGNKDKMYSCSTAAGPAFEGANIKCGIGGIKGAIDKVKINETVEYTTINNKKPLGICGSGIVDVIAEMLNAGIIDYTGRIDDKENLDGNISKDLSNRIIEYNNDNAFIVEYADNAQTEDDIIITQKDVRELQNAKAAIAAGILTLIKVSGYEYEDIDAFYIAGGFGNYLKLDSAARIGLVPDELKNKVINAGNAAGAGALLFISSSNSIKDVNYIKKHTKYIELSSNPDFNNEYVNCMFF